MKAHLEKQNSVTYGEKHQQQMKFKAAMLSGDITPYI